MAVASAAEALYLRLFPPDDGDAIARLIEERIYAKLAKYGIGRR
jgi:hypothetical protein